MNMAFAVLVDLGDGKACFASDVHLDGKAICGTLAPLLSSVDIDRAIEFDTFDQAARYAMLIGWRAWAANDAEEAAGRDAYHFACGVLVDSEVDDA